MISNIEPEEEILDDGFQCGTLSEVGQLILQHNGQPPMEYSAMDAAASVTSKMLMQMHQHRVTDLPTEHFFLPALQPSACLTAAHSPTSGEGVDCEGKPSAGSSSSSISAVHSLQSVHSSQASSSQLPSTKLAPLARTAEEGLMTERIFVELAEYPGFDPQRVTPLPQGFDTVQHMSYVTSCQSHLKGRSFYKKEWRRAFYSAASSAMLLDYFWWIFLNRFKPGKDVVAQSRLFSRIADDYVKLLGIANDLIHKDGLLRDFPVYVAQCVYSAFSHIFPTSGARFGWQFRDDVYSTIFTWVSGVKPIPYNWRSWPFHLLDSVAMTKDMSDKKQAEEASKTQLRVGQELHQQLFIDSPATALSTASSPSSKTTTAAAATSVRRKSWTASGDTSSSAIPPTIGTGNKLPKLGAVQKTPPPPKRKRHRSVPESSTSHTSLHDPLSPDSSAKKSSKRTVASKTRQKPGARRDRPEKGRPIRTHPKAEKVSTTCAVPEIRIAHGSDSAVKCESVVLVTDSSSAINASAAAGEPCEGEASSRSGDEGVASMDSALLASSNPSLCASSGTKEVQVTPVKRHAVRKTKTASKPYPPADGFGTAYTSYLFNTAAHSPLLQDYFNRHGTKPTGAPPVCLQRRQLTKLPSHSDGGKSAYLVAARTIEKTMASINDSVHSTVARALRECAHADKRLVAYSDDMDRRVEKLLTKKEEVERLALLLKIDTETAEAGSGLYYKRDLFPAGERALRDALQSLTMD